MDPYGSYGNCDPYGPYGYGAVQSNNYGGMPGVEITQKGIRRLADTLHKIPKLDRNRPGPSLLQLLPVLFVPWLTFVITNYTQGFWLRYQYPWMSFGFACWLLLPVALFAFLSYAATKDSKLGDNRALGATFFLSLVAWVAAMYMGHNIYTEYMEEFFQLSALATYPNVNPSNFTGAQLMDAGVVLFNPKAQLNRSLSVGFKNEHVYCVAPVVMPDQGKQFDFWAVGVDCCSGHTTDFKCGEYSNQLAHSGVRLLREDQRPFFRLAVKEAEAMYNLPISNPIFVHYVQDAETAVANYEEAGWRDFLVSGLITFSVLLFLTVAFGLVLGM